MKLISKLIETLFNLKIVRSKKFYKLINSEKNYVISLSSIENYKNLIKNLILDNEKVNNEFIKNIKSQNLQDLVALDLLGFKRNGIFIEAGACNGIINSNTYLMEKMYTWDGLLIEPIKDYFDELENNRNVLCMNYALSSKVSNSEDFLLTDSKDLSTLKGYEDNDYHHENRLNFTPTKVKTTTLTNLLEEKSFPNDIDFLSLDTEGSEFEILKTINFSKYKIRIICVEHNFNINREEIFKFLVDKNYKRIDIPIIDIDDFYIHNDFKPKNRYFFYT